MKVPTVLVLAIVASACGETTASRATSPTSPTATFLVSGGVFETTSAGPRPVDGARIAVDFQVRATSDGNGFYSISEVPAGRHSVAVTKDGYVSTTQDVTLGGDIRLDVRMVRIGNYRLFGVVFEETPTGRTPIGGVHVEWGDDHSVSMTDLDGFYSFAQVSAGPTSVWAAKEGYEGGRRSVTVDGDTRFDIQIVRR